MHMCRETQCYTGGWVGGWVDVCSPGSETQLPGHATSSLLARKFVGSRRSTVKRTLGPCCGPKHCPRPTFTTVLPMALVLFDPDNVPQTHARVRLGRAKGRLIEVELRLGEAATTGSSTWMAGELLARVCMSTSALSQALCTLPRDTADVPRAAGPAIGGVGPGAATPTMARARCCELGAGLGLVSIACGLAGCATMVATDGNRDILEVLNANFDRNVPVSPVPGQASPARTRLVVEQLDWNDADAIARVVADNGPFDFILAADCVFGTEPQHRLSHQALVEALVALCAGAPDAVVLLSHQKRYDDVDGAFFARLRERFADCGEIDTAQLGIISAPGPSTVLWAARSPIADAP